jgi:cell wall-associated NlpC family hydrolase
MLTLRTIRDFLRMGMLLVGLACGVLMTTIAAAQQTPTAAKPQPSAEQTYYQRLIAKVEPTLQGSPERLPLYIGLLKREMIDDPEQSLYDVEARRQADGTVLLTGLVGFEENRQALLKLFGYLGFKRIEQRIEVLPSQDLGQRQFGLVSVSHTYLLSQPTGRREVLTDCLLGSPVYLLKEAADGYFLCQCADAYVGYIDGRDIRRLDRGQFSRYQAGPQVRIQRDYKQAQGVMLPVAARLKWIRNQGDVVLAELPGGASVAVPADHCRTSRNVPSQRVEHVLQVATRMLGTKYLWGGNTSSGIDCSGLVQTAFMAEGINLPRNASQQARLGSLTATRWYRDGLRRGDTLYFLGSNGKISHTALYLGDGRYLEAVPPAVQYTSFDRQDKDYNQRRAAAFCFAKRLLD